MWQINFVSMSISLQYHVAGHTDAKPPLFAEDTLPLKTASRPLCMRAKLDSDTPPITTSSRGPHSTFGPCHARHVMRFRVTTMAASRHAISIAPRYVYILRQVCTQQSHLLAGIKDPHRVHVTCQTCSHSLHKVANAAVLNCLWRCTTDFWSIKLHTLQQLSV